MNIPSPLSSLLPKPHEILPGDEAQAQPSDPSPPPTEEAATVPPEGQRRREERVALDLVIFTYPLGETERGASRSETRNVSSAGMFIAADRPPAKGQVLFLEAFPTGSDEEAVRSRAVVRWRRRWLEPRGMGVELLDVGDEERDRLRRWMGEEA